MNERVGVIDVGTNSILALGIQRDGTILFNDYEVSEFGQGMKANNGYLLEPRINVAFQIISSFIKKLQSLDINDIIIIGTSASRDAKNIHIMIDMIYSEFQIKYNIISGDQEAEFTYLGALSLYQDPSEIDFVMMDIGGGSTEVIYGKGDQITFKQSFQLGVVRLKEQFPFDQLDQNTLSKIQSHIKSFYNTLNEPPKNAVFLGIGGTFTTVGSMALKMEKYDPQQINGLTLSLETSQNIFNSINSIPLSERIKIKGLEEKRAPLMTFGMQIYMNFMSHFGLETLMLTDFGLRYGVAKNYFKST